MANYAYHRQPYWFLNTERFWRNFADLPVGTLSYFDYNPRSAFEWWIRQLDPSESQRRAFWDRFDEYWNRWVMSQGLQPYDGPKTFIEYLGSLNPTHEMLRLPSEYRSRGMTIPSRTRWLSF
jgi:hypothetical protein